MEHRAKSRGNLAYCPNAWTSLKQGYAVYTLSIYSLSPAVICVADSWPSVAAAASGHTQLVKAGWS